MAVCRFGLILSSKFEAAAPDLVPIPDQGPSLSGPASLLAAEPSGVVRWAASIASISALSSSVSSGSITLPAVTVSIFSTAMRASD